MCSPEDNYNAHPIYKDTFSPMLRLGAIARHYNEGKQFISTREAAAEAESFGVGF